MNGRKIIEQNSVFKNNIGMTAFSRRASFLKES
jgi:hypothetical protein